MGRFIVDRNLGDRSKLEFFFPVASEGNKFIKITLPFLENIQVAETKAARLSKYNLLSRSSNLYSYLGADSRRFSITFNITFSHVEEDTREIGTLFNKIFSEVTLDNPLVEQAKFLDSGGKSIGPSKFSFAENQEQSYLTGNVEDSVKQVLGYFTKYLRAEELVYLYSLYETSNYGKQPDINNGLGSTGSPAPNAGDNVVAQLTNGMKEKRRRAINLIVYWVNIIRASVVNNSKSPALGPPTVRFTHGILYQDVPCICTDYSINYNEMAGYDVFTLLPKQIQITLNLEENRTGDFSDYDPAHPVKRDNLTGYEVLIGDGNNANTLDPGVGNNLGLPGV